MKIEKGIPFPNKKNHEFDVFPFGDMEVTDSIFFPCDDSNGYQSKISYYLRKYPDRKFSFRKVEGGIRMWRIQ